MEKQQFTAKCIQVTASSDPKRVVLTFDTNFKRYNETGEEIESNNFSRSTRSLLNEIEVTNAPIKFKLAMLKAKANLNVIIPAELLLILCEGVEFNVIGEPKAKNDLNSYGKPYTNNAVHFTLNSKITLSDEQKELITLVCDDFLQSLQNAVVTMTTKKLPSWLQA